MRHIPHSMRGHLLAASGAILATGGFMPANLPPGGIVLGNPALAAPQSIIARGAGLNAELKPETLDALEQIQRGTFAGDVNTALAQIVGDLATLQRGVTTANTAFPVRENLEAPAARLVPTETPLRNMLPRVPGAGLATAWRQLISLGGGWGTAYDQPGGVTAIRMFYPETGAPVEHTSQYAAKQASYKLLGTLGSVSGLAAASGSNYQDQIATERSNQLVNLMLNEELALIYGDSAAIAAPWGDGTNALAFDGLWKLISTANGTPTAQVQTAVGALTTAHIDAQLSRIYKQGGRGLFMLMNSQEALSLARLLQASGSIQRVQITDQGDATLGFRVARYINPLGGEPVDIYTSLFLLPGDMIFGARRLPDGSPAIEVEVLPQVPFDLAPEKPQQIQGYVVTELAKTISQPDMNPFVITAYEVLKMKSALHFARSTGVLPAA